MLPIDLQATEHALPTARPRNGHALDGCRAAETEMRNGLLLAEVARARVDHAHLGAAAAVAQRDERAARGRAGARERQHAQVVVLREVAGDQVSSG